MLRFDPKERISARVALLHPYFDDIRPLYEGQYTTMKAYNPKSRSLWVEKRRFFPGAILLTFIMILSFFSLLVQT